MTPNLPPHLQEKIDEIEKSLFLTNSCEAESYKRYGFEKGYQTMYSLIMQELGPVVGALSEMSEPLTHTATTVGQLDSYVCALSEQALKHLKERIFTQERTEG